MRRLHWAESLASSENSMCKVPVAGRAGVCKQRKQHVPVQKSQGTEHQQGGSSGGRKGYAVGEIL